MSAPSPPLRVSRQFAAAASRVFDAWIEPEIAGKWLFATPTGQMTRVEIDARVGGRFAIVERRDGQDVEHVGEYLDVVRPERLVFTFSVPKFSTVFTRVSIAIVPGSSGCELTLTHEGVLPEWRDRTQAGWGMLLDSLANQLDKAV